MNEKQRQINPSKVQQRSNGGRMGSKPVPKPIKPVKKKS